MWWFLQIWNITCDAYFETPGVRVSKTEGPTLAWCAQGELTNFYYDFSGKNKWRDCESMLLFPVLLNFQCHRRTDYCKFQYFLAAVSSHSQTGSEHRTSNDFILLWFAIKLYLLMLYDQKSIKTVEIKSVVHTFKADICSSGTSHYAE